MKIEFERATIGDVDALIKVRNESFYEDYIKYGECPRYNNSKERITSITFIKKRDIPLLRNI